MGHRGRVLLPAALALCAWMCQTAAARSVALLVAVGTFSDPGMKTHELGGPASDIDSLQRALTEHWGFLPADVVTLRDQEATRQHILDQISALEQRSAPGDTVLIYYSGHGTSANDADNGYALPYWTGAWVPYDVRLSGPVADMQKSLIVGRWDLVPRLKRLDEGGRWVVVVSDSCFSGQVVRSFGQRFSQSRYLPMNTRDLGVSGVPAVITPRPDPPPYPYHHVVLLSGASDSEAGADISSLHALQLAPTLDGKFHGAFTDALLRLLDGQLRPAPFNYAEGRDSMLFYLEHRNFPQHPQLLPAVAEDPQDIGSRPFLGMKPPSGAGGGSSSGGGTGAGGGSGATGASGGAAHDATLHVQFGSVPAALKAKVAGLSGVAIVERQGDMIIRQNGEQVQLMGPAGDPIVSAPAGDPNLIKRITAQVWLNRVLPAGNDSLGLRADTDPGSRGNTYLQCESFVFEVRLKKSAYVMLLDLDSEGNLTVLYPTRASERQIVAGGAPRAIPSADPKDHILVTAPFGSDQVAVMAFEHLPDFFVDLTGAQRFAADGSRAAALAKGLAGAGEAGAVSVQQITVHTYPATGKVFCGS